MAEWAIIVPVIGFTLGAICLILYCYVQERRRRMLHESLLAQRQAEMSVRRLKNDGASDDMTAEECEAYMQMAAGMPTISSDKARTDVEEVNAPASDAPVVADADLAATTGSDLAKGNHVWYHHRSLGWLQMRIDKVDYEGVFDDGGATYIVSAPQLQGEVIETVRERLFIDRPDQQV